MTAIQPDIGDDLLDDLLGDFLDESDQLLTQMNENLLQLDEWVQELGEDHQQRCDDNLMNEMFRAAHSLKGLSAMLGLDDINNLTHKLENVFDAARKDELIITGDVAELMFMGLDQLVALVQLLKEPGGEPVECDAVLDAIRRLLHSADAEREQAAQADAEHEECSDGSKAGDSALACEADPFEGLQDEEEISDKYLSIFIDECEVSLERLTSGLLALEGGGNGDELKNLLGTAHKIKGSAASIGLNRVAKLTHLMEDLLEDLVETGGALAPGTADAFVKCADALQDYVTGLKEGTASSEHFGQLGRGLLAPQSDNSPADGQSSADCPDSPAVPRSEKGTVPLTLSERLESVLAEIREGLESTETRTVTSVTGMAAGTLRRVRAGENVKLDSIKTLAAFLDSGAEIADGRTIYVGQVTFRPDLPTAGLKAQLVYEKLVKLGDVSDCQPSPEELDDIDELDCFRFSVASEQSVEAIADQVRVAGVVEASIEPLDVRPPKPKARSKTQKTKTKDRDTDKDKCDVPDEGQVSSLPSGQDTLPTEDSDIQARSASKGPSPAQQAGVKDPSLVRRASVEDSPTPDGPERQQGPAGVQPSGCKDSGTQARSASKGPLLAQRASVESSPAAKADPAAPPPIPKTAQPVQEAKARGPETGQRPTETVRVDIDRLDHLMNLAGQLVINKAQFTQIGEKFKTVLSCKQSVHVLNKVSAELNKIGDLGSLRVDGQHDSAERGVVHSQIRRIQNDLEPLRREVQTLTHARDHIRELYEAIHQLDRVSDGIQQSVMDTRMVPIGPLFTRFKRVIRDITRSNGKSVRLEISGEKTELDKRMIDELGDPLVHMVRNSADHGIESPGEREAAGKPRQGTVKLDAFHRGNSIVIQVSDDGKGLDADRILAKCLDKGIVTQADAEKMTPHQIHQMIWEPGLSTAEEVTEVSGRGMGMDIVKSKIDELSGTVDIDSAPGRGTTITIKLPLTLAILPSLMVDIRGDVFAMPMEAVVEIVSVGPEHLRTVHGRKLASVRGREVSLVRLGDMLSFHGEGDAVQASQSRHTTLVIVGEAGCEIGLDVDRVIGEEDIVIKSIAENYKNIVGIAGASILGDGRVSLILDIPALIEMISKRTGSVGVMA